ncbi:hypothetical protein [Spirosoma sp. 48-14]|uniref:hypothetical protein n=1 Tax=Spirosoma sp. 48-14 TaxID=1895854 RepID=UPI0009668E06|nr:hypothetical protein [Spirosoma sp. 48-14]OJW78457.1 MAG: hypothetical protein BGO59_31125 [Spirosoma sp. 48-14]
MAFLSQLAITVGNFVNGGKDKFNEAIKYLPVKFTFLNGILSLVLNDKPALTVDLTDYFPTRDEVVKQIRPGNAGLNTPGLVTFADSKNPTDLQSDAKVLSAAAIVELIAAFGGNGGGGTVDLQTLFSALTPDVKNIIFRLLLTAALSDVQTRQLFCTLVGSCEVDPTGPVFDFSSPVDWEPIPAQETPEIYAPNSEFITGAETPEIYAPNSEFAASNPAPTLTNPQADVTITTYDNYEIPAPANEFSDNAGDTGSIICQRYDPATNTVLPLPLGITANNTTGKFIVTKDFANGQTITLRRVYTDSAGQWINDDFLVTTARPSVDRVVIYRDNSDNITFFYRSAQSGNQNLQDTWTGFDPVNETWLPSGYSAPPVTGRPTGLEGYQYQDAYGSTTAQTAALSTTTTFKIRKVGQTTPLLSISFNASSLAKGQTLTIYNP